MSTELANTERKPLALRDRLQAMAPEFKKALPGHIPVEKFIRTVQTAVQMQPQISRAASSSKEGLQSLLAACTKAATDGLILDGREATLVTFKQKGANGQYEDRIQYLPMVAGLLKKARNSGEIASIAAHVVYQKDRFIYVLGDDEKIIHEPFLEGDRGAPIAVYAIARLKDGSVQREVMSRDDVMRIAAQSKNSKQYQPDSPNYGEWWRKTVIRRISKYLPSSSDRDEFQQAVDRIDDDFDFPADPAQEQPKAPKKRRGAAADVLHNVMPAEDVEDAEIIEADPETGEIMEPDQDDGDDI